MCRRWDIAVPLRQIDRSVRLSEPESFSTPGTGLFASMKFGGLRRNPSCPVEVLQEVVSAQLDRLVAPLGRPVDTGDERAAVHPPEVTENEGVTRLGVVVGRGTHTQVPGGALVPRGPFQERV